LSYCILEEKLHIWWRGLFLKTSNFKLRAIIINVCVPDEGTTSIAHDGDKNENRNLCSEYSTYIYY